MRKLVLLSLFINSMAWGQFKPQTKTTSSGIDIAKLIGAEVANNEQWTTRKPSQKMAGLAAEARGMRSLTAKFSDLRVVRDSTQQAVFIEGRLRPNAKNAQARKSADAAYFEYVDGLKDVLHLKQPTEELKIVSSQTDDLAHRHTRMQQTFKGLSVYGGEAILHSDPSGEVSLLNGHLFPTPEIQDVTPKLSAIQIQAIVQQDLGTQAIVRMMGQLEKKLLNYEQPQAELLIYHPNDNPTAERLTWQITVRPNFLERWQYFVDANTGEILEKFNHTCALDGPAKATATDLNGVARSINTYSYNNRYFMIDGSKPMFKASQFQIDNPVGALWTIDAANSTVDDISVKQVSSTNNAWSNPTAVSAHYNAGVAYEYYRTTHSRNSLNGKGGTIISIINITDEGGRGFDNAFWNGEFMGYGNGKDAFKPLAGGLDVAGHEMTHGVIENTANLEYKGQSGAINESMADVFGVLIDRDDWTLGEDVTKKTAYPTGFLRNMSDPNNGGKNLNDAGYQPKNMGQYYTGSQDNYGVHINSGIPNYAFYLFASNASVGKDKAEKVYYRALTTYLTKTSKFLDLRLAIVKAATDLYGASSTEVNVAKSAFDAVGITEPNQSTPPPTTDVPVNTGQEFLLSYDPVLKGLYVSNTAPKTSADFRELVKNITISHKPSVTDDGKYAYFVASDKKIKRVNLQGTAVLENVSSDAVWDNVAISKDGKRLAALTTDPDKSIYVFNLGASPVTSKKFTLYNPTYTQGVQTGQVQYADAIQWDISGEYIVYDAFNKLKNAEGKTVDFWDVGFIDAWNNGTNNFGMGEIQKLFTDLEEGESIGNPSFSKNSTNILSFDYYDSIDNLYYILGVDVEDNNVGLIFENNTLGFPEYSRQDNRMLFNTKKGSSENTNIITLKTDKITATGSASTLIEDSKWAVWYTVGTRTLPQKQNQTISVTSVADKLTNDAPFTIVASTSSGLTLGYVVLSGPATISGNRVTLTGATGQVQISVFQEGNTQYYRATPVTITFNVNAITGLEPAFSANDIQLFPNPAQEQLMIRMPQGLSWESMQLTTATGNTVLQVGKQQGNEVLLNIGSLPSGLYVLGIQTTETVLWKKIRKE
ncbi:MAG: M4 family metallopeptidase [Spirosomataceae bacterium]